MPEPLHTASFPVLGTVLGISSPLPRRELDAAARGVSLMLAGYLGAGSGRSLQAQIDAVAIGSLALEDSSQTVRSLHRLALHWRERTLGAFTPGERYPELAGLLRPYLMGQAASVLLDFGIPHWAVNLGGDIACSGSPTPSVPTGSDPFYGTPWRAGITDPFGPGLLLADVPLAGTPGFTAALATSAGTPASTYRQVSVLGPDIVEADVLATAILSGGADVLRAALAGSPVQVLAVHHDGALEASTRWPTYATEPAAPGAPPY
ncbi:FAD:protein FMN transferase [Paeniglutamicibacter cryotolerans]|uniref:Thiamine biosynthesis lipoprotein n=1 Tax=Paeniglutamicibacter cryotolerans TaxID=670079 RepID=A0A839QFI2_9MICC|nr:FAD:protein FMN transferase [Paeniglutamicibacter cryotolerans]MBB2994383.1 thiamine biosynthesis lipoprotein [Paeniglutamicibacter cryotolerans]